MGVFPRIGALPHPTLGLECKYNRCLGPKLKCLVSRCLVVTIVITIIQTLKFFFQILCATRRSEGCNIGPTKLVK